MSTGGGTKTYSVAKWEPLLSDTPQSSSAKILGGGMETQVNSPRPYRGGRWEVAAIEERLV